MVVCSFPAFTYPMHADLMAAVTGWDTGLAELVHVAERIMTVFRLFNIREGLSATDDQMPERYYQPKTDGILSDKPLNKAQLEKARGHYYNLMGWDARGVPLPDKVQELYIE